MKKFIKVEYCIDENMAWYAIQHLLNGEKRVSKSAIISLCKMHLAREGNLFETSPEFDEREEYICVDPGLVDHVFEKVWK